MPLTDTLRGNLWVAEAWGRPSAVWDALAIPSGNAAAKSVAPSSKMGKVASLYQKGQQGQTYPQSPIQAEMRARGGWGCVLDCLLVQAAHHTLPLNTIHVFKEGQVLVRKRMADTW